MAVCSVPGDYEVRRAEALDAAAILGCELRILMDGGSRRIEDVKTYQLVGMIDDVVRDVKPAAMLTHGSTDFHGDHVLVHHASVPSQRLHDFVGSTIRGLEFFGGVPEVMVPDQLRSAVKGPDRYEPDINATCLEMAQHYGRELHTGVFYRSAAPAPTYEALVRERQEEQRAGAPPRSRVLDRFAVEA